MFVQLGTSGQLMQEMNGCTVNNISPKPAGIYLGLCPQNGMTIPFSIAKKVYAKGKHLLRGTPQGQSGPE